MFVSRRMVVLPEAERLSGARPRIANLHAIEGRAVRRVEIQDAISRRDELESDVSARDGRVGQSQSAGGSGPHERACRPVGLEDGRPPGIGPLDDDEPKHFVRRAGRRCDV